MITNEIREQTRQAIIQGILNERARQDKKFGQLPRNRSPELWLTILTEEVGEVARATLENNQDTYVTELVQVAAVAIAALEDHYLKAMEG